VRPGFARSDERELLRPVQRACLDPVEHLERVDGSDGRDLHGQVRSPLRVEPSYAGPAGEQCVPRARDVTAHRRSGTKSGDDDFRHAATPAFSM
jgi:hypothetical protein